MKHAHFRRKAPQNFILVINTPQGAALMARLGFSANMEVRLDKSGSTYQALRVSRGQATEICQRCLQELCSCSSKYNAPVILCKPVARRGRATPLTRRELPIRIRKAA